MSDRHRTQQVAYLLGPERIELREEPVPEPGPGEVLLRIGAATTCGTDLKVFLAGGHARMLRAPCPFGHEMAGTAEAVGSGVRGVAAGDRIVVVNSASCGVCDACMAGRENLCADLRYLNGAFAETVLVPERFVRRSTYPCPPGIDFGLAALTEPLACVLHGVEACGLSTPGDVLLLGAGPIGLLFTAVLAAAGHHVTLSDLDRSRLDVGRLLGAAETVPAGTTPLPPAGLVVEATGARSAWEAALASVRPGGTVVLFGGCPSGTVVPLDAQRLHYCEITVKGVYHHRPATVRSALEALASGTLALHHLLGVELPLARLEEALRAMQRHEILKAVIRPGTP